MAVGSLIEFPSIILAALRRRRLVVDFFPVVLTDIGDKQIARFLVEMEHVRIAQAISPDFWPRADLVLSEPLLIDAEQRHQLCLVCFGERIVLWNGVGSVVWCIDIDAQKLAPQNIEVLPSIERIAFPAGIALSDVQFAIRSERDHTAVMIVVGLRDVHQNLHALGELF